MTACIARLWLIFATLVALAAFSFGLGAFAGLGWQYSAAIAIYAFITLWALWTID